MDTSTYHQRLCSGWRKLLSSHGTDSVHTLEVDGGHTLRSASESINPAPETSKIVIASLENGVDRIPSTWRISTSLTPSRVPAELLVQLIPQTESMLANVTVRCDLTNNARSSLPFRIAEGWILEGSIRSNPTFPCKSLRPPQNLHTRSRFSRIQSSTIEASSLNCNCEDSILPSIENLYKFLLARFLSSKVSSSKVLCRALPTWLKMGGFSLKPSVEALRYRVRERQIVEWQKRRLRDLPSLGCSNPKPGRCQTCSSNGNRSIFSWTTKRMSCRWVIRSRSSMYCVAPLYPVAFNVWPFWQAIDCITPSRGAFANLRQVKE